MRAGIRSFLVVVVLLFATSALANTTYVVKRGDYLGKIAAEHNCRISDIVAWNPGLNPDRIQVGQKIVLKNGTSSASDAGGAQPDAYTVVAGDTMMGIAEKLHVSYKQLRAANPKVNPNQIQIGQRLRVPDRAAATGASSGYTVQSGDTMMGIASKVGVSYSALRAANQSVDPNRLQVGQHLNVPTGPEATGGARVHVVESGDTITAIAAQYGVSIADLRAWNPKMNPDRIQIGQRIHIQSARPVRTIHYTVVQGDIIGKIAERYNVTVSELETWNPKLDPDRIHIGQKIRIFQEGPEKRSESSGTASHGKLVHGEQLKSGVGFKVRSKRRAWGTNQTVTYIIDGYEHMEKVYKHIPKVWVHDLSKKGGGHLKPHLSHQSGRDADIGYYHSGCSQTLCPYGAIRASQLNAAYQWTLFSYWINHGWVKFIFMDYTLQEPLYKYAKSHGVSDAQLRKIFQYPRGRHSHHGLIRHWAGHRSHFHVRFKCSASDPHCR